MDFDQLYPSRFMKAGQFQGKDVTLTISGVKKEVLEGDKGKEEKAIVTFEKTPKQFVMNKTNGTSIMAMFGRETNGWIGKRVTLYPASITDSFTGEKILAIRVRGSPDIDGDKNFTARIGRKQVPMRVVRTGARAAAKPASKPVEPAHAPAETAPMTAAEAAEIEAAERAMPEEPGWMNSEAQ